MFHLLICAKLHKEIKCNYFLTLMEDANYDCTFNYLKLNNIETIFLYLHTI